jgi:hypothetical protein
MDDMKQQALTMIVGMLMVAVVISVDSHNPLPLIVMAAVSYVVWHVAKGLDG